MANVKIQVITYEESRLEHFKNKRIKYQKQLDLLEQHSNSMNAQATQEKHIQLSQAGEIVQYYDDVVKMLEADVVPKSEVERLRNHINRLKKYDEERDIALHSRLIAETRKKVAREIFEEMQSCLIQRHWNGLDIVSFEFDAVKYAELKKQYTESEGKG